MASSSNNILQNCLNETSVVSATVSKNMIIGSPTVPIQNELLSNVSLDGFQQVENKNKNKIKRKLATSTTLKKRTRYQTNIISKPVPPLPLVSMPDPIANEPFLHKIVQHVGSTLHIQGVQQVQNENAHELQDIQPVSNDPEAQRALSASHPEQISITNESARYAQTRYSFPPFIIRFNAGKVTSNKIKEEIKTRYPQIKNVIRLKNKFNNDIKLVKLELTSSSVREELLIKRKITVDYIVYDIEEYLAPENILICSKCMGLGHFMKQCTQVKSTCRTCGECADDLKLHACSSGVTRKKC
ncbi:unnamed protein product [Rotaria magnacalcarata]|uniref:CCHC-type domain-containing protein n=2 Tax=Rotaria magnacalcarata TaxID=392030 RepID=A0A8S2Y725_9BILA|nr:unnamed protein product [Rotaria magnacalcarata]